MLISSVNRRNCSVRVRAFTNCRANIKAAWTGQALNSRKKGYLSSLRKWGWFPMESWMPTLETHSEGILQVHTSQFTSWTGTGWMLRLEMGVPWFLTERHLSKASQNNSLPSFPYEMCRAIVMVSFIWVPVRDCTDQVVLRASQWGIVLIAFIDVERPSQKSGPHYSLVSGYGLYKNRVS